MKKISLPHKFQVDYVDGEWLLYYQFRSSRPKKTTTRSLSCLALIVIRAILDNRNQGYKQIGIDKWVPMVFEGGKK